MPSTKHYSSRLSARFVNFPRATRAALAALATAALLAVTLPALPASAAPVVPRVSGVVTVDTNANGTIDTTTATGHNEPGLAGVQLELLCVASDAVVATTTSDASGVYSFEAIDFATLCPDGVVEVRATIADDRYSITDGSGTDNDTTRTANERVGLSAPITLTAGSDETVNSLVRPDWYLDLAIPVDGSSGQPAVYTGSAPFDTVCPEAGHDCSIDDSTVRSADTVTYTWAVTASSLDDLSPTLDAVVLEQTLDLSGGAIANFARIPARCKPTGGGGAVPPSVIVDQNGTPIPEGQMPLAGTTSVTLRCNLGTWEQTGDAVTLQPVVKTSPLSPNGSTFTTTASVYAVDANNIPTAVPASPETHGPIDITSAPAYELDKKGFFQLDVGQRDIGNGVEYGYYTYAVIQVKTNRLTGVEAVRQPITVTEDLFGIAPNGTDALPGMQFAITDCRPNQNAWGGTVGGKLGPYGGFTDPANTVSNSGSCAVNRDAPGDLTSDYTLTFSGIDMSGTHYPTKSIGGADLSAGPFYVASYQVQIFIPKSTIDAADGVPNDDKGSFQLYNRVGGFDPDGISGGNSNFGPGVEPGYCDPASVDGQPLNGPGMPHCAPMPGGGRSDNVIGPITVVFAPGNFTKYILNTHTLYTPDWNTGDGVTGLTSPHAGNGTGEPGQVYESYLDYVNNSVAPISNARTCDVFDGTMFSLVSSAEGMDNGDPTIYATLAADQIPLAQRPAYNQKWIFEYAHIAITGDDPISGGTIDPVTGRIAGSWTNQASTTCDDSAAAGGWQADPNAVPGGINEVNAVRVRPGIDPQTGQATLFNPGINNRLIFSMKIRGQFNGGPHDGQAIPEGAVAANYGHIDNGTGTWSAPRYKPSPENTSTDGDRITITQAKLAIQKRTITVDGIGDGAADFGVTGSAVASNPIVWEVVSSLSSVSNQPAPVQNLTITDVLPNYADYDQDCTASITGGTVADEVLLDTPSPGKTTLIWHLGQWTPNTAIPNRRICTNSDPLAPNGTSLVNHSDITFDGSVQKPFDDHTVILDQTGEVKLRKKVDAPLDVLNDDQKYNLSMQNFSDTLTIGAPTVIEVFPYNGDANPPGGVNRSPSSAFSGALALTGPATVSNLSGGAYNGTFYYTTDAPNTVNQNLTLNTSTWVTAAALGGDFSHVTAIKFVGADNLTPLSAVATSGLSIDFSLQAGDVINPFSANANHAGDRYSDRFTAFSSTFSSADGRLQTLASNRTTVRTVSHSVGDLIFEDRDGDGKYDAARDRLVPDGVPVNLIYEGASGDTQVASTTTTSGIYLFTKLPAGTYHLQIPASAFTPGGILEGWHLTSAPAAGTSEADVDENDNVSHDAIAGPLGSIESNSFTLSATVSRTGAVTGDEPTGENIHGIEDLTTTDPFSNLAIDLALQRDPAIDIEKEVCTLTDNSCDPDAALAAGGWSADGVAGAGPDTEVANRPYGSDVLWRITVTNTGQQYLTDVAVTDAVESACAADSTTVASFGDFTPGASEHYDCTTTGITANITPNTADVVGTPSGGGDAVTDVDTANAVTTGSLVINKTLDGAGVEDFGTEPFEFTVVCTLNGSEVVNQTVTLTPTAGSTALTSDPIDQIPLGSNCVVTEVDNGGADATPPPVSVQIVSNDNRNVVVAQIANEFSKGTLEVTKELDGSAADTDYVKGLTFTLLVTCQVDASDADGRPVRGTVYSGSLEITGGETVAIVDGNDDPVALPVGTHCFGEETDSQGATKVSIDHGSFDDAAVVAADPEAVQKLTITATNTFDVASIAVTKHVVGPGSAGPYSFTVTCTAADGSEFPLSPGDASFQLSHNQTRTIEVIKGVDCTVKEVDVPSGAVSTIVDSDATSDGGTSDGVVSNVTGTETVVVTNSYQAVASPPGLAKTGSTLDPLGPTLGGGLLIGGLLVLLIALRRRKPRVAPPPSSR